MKYTHATLLLNETSAEINETNLTAVLEAAGDDVDVSRVKAVVASLEDVDLSEYAAEHTGDADATAGAETAETTGEPGDEDREPPADDESFDVETGSAVTGDAEEER